MALKSRAAVEEEDADGYECCAQWLLLLFNLPLLLIGIALVALGAWTLSERDYINALGLSGGSLYVALAALMIVTGCVLVVWAVYGCVAAFLENKNALLVYYVVIVVVFVLLLIAILLGYVYRMKIADHLREELIASVPSYDPARPDAQATRSWDRMQSELECCGVADTSPAAATTTVNPPYTVWKDNRLLNSGGNAELRVPESCCLSAGDGQRADCSSAQSVDPQLIFTADCFDSAADFLQGHTALVGAACIVFAVTLIVAAALSICLYFLADA